MEQPLNNTNNCDGNTEKPPVQIDDNTHALITLHLATPKELECSRNLKTIKETLESAIESESIDKSAINATVILKALSAPEEGVDPSEFEPQVVELSIAKGTCQEVLDALDARIPTPAQAMAALQRFPQDIGEISGLKGAIVTAVFDEARVGGFSVLNNLLDVERVDIVQLGTAATGHADLFKDKMRERDIEFPEDNDKRIILPGGGRA